MISNEKVINYKVVDPRSFVQLKKNQNIRTSNIILEP